MKSTEMKHDITVFLLYVCGFLLLWEWLRPLKQLTDTDNLFIFIVFILLSFVFAFLEVKMLAQFFIKSLYIVYSIYYLYFEGGFFHKKWFGIFLDDLKENIGYVLDSAWNDMSNIFRSLLFFVLLWLMTYLIQYWLLNRQRIFIFFFMTLIYITVLDTFSPYKANAAIVRTVVIGFSVLGMLTFFRLLSKEKVEKDHRHTGKWMVPLAIMIAVSSGIGYLAPKAAPIWPDPVPYLKSYSDKNGTGGGGAKKIGYGTNDSQLGGPFIGDKTVVYRIEAKEKSYWKVESKDRYTGKGWEAGVEDVEKIEKLPFTAEGPVPLDIFAENVEVKEAWATVMPYKEYPHIIYPLGVKNFEVYQDSSFAINLELEKIYSYDGTRRPTPIDHYAVFYDVPKYSVKELMKNTGAGVDERIRNRYLSLPEELPERVRDLAREITAGKTNWFDQAQAIEKYFDRPEFVYDQTDVAIPGKDDDYVDQFLFETKRGYCDNFSTSMVVMLRSIGIPARWVKGYTEGEVKEYSEDDSNIKIFEITNNNAHSWVEAYFPNQGWVTFEPTKSFTNNASFLFDNNNDKPDSSTATPPVPAPRPNEDRLNKLEGDTKTVKRTFSAKDIWINVKNFVAEKWKWIILFLIVFVALANYIYDRRGRWLPQYFLYRYKFKTKDESLNSAYMVLLKQLERYGIKRKENQTLRDYARYIDHFFSSKEMSRLTSRYEQTIYGNKPVKGSWKETKKLWENLIKKTIA